MAKLTKVQLKQLVLEEFTNYKKLQALQKQKEKLEESIEELEEKHLSRSEQKSKEHEVKNLKNNPNAVDSFKKQYGKDWKSVMYGKATNDAKNGH